MSSIPQSFQGRESLVGTDKMLGTDTTSLPSQNSTTTIQVRYLPVAARASGRAFKRSVTKSVFYDEGESGEDSEIVNLEMFARASQVSVATFSIDRFILIASL